MYFNRAWAVDIDGSPFIRSSGALQLRTQFDITVSPQDAIAFADIRIYNLSKDTSINRDSSVTFQAGYENASDTIFIGSIINVLRERDGPSTVTRLLCRSGTSFKDRGSASSSYGKGAKVIEVLKDLARQWPRFLTVDEKQFTNSVVLTSGYVVDGDITQALDDLGYQYDFDWTQERGSIVINRRGWPRATPTFEVNQYTGMRGVPEVTRGPEGLGLNVVMSLNPYIRSNSRINVQSEFSTFNTGNLFIQQVSGDASVNGTYNVLSIAYKGDSHGDRWDVEIDGVRELSAKVPFNTAGAISPAPNEPLTDNITSTLPINGQLIWGTRVNQEFRAKVREICKRLRINPNWLMAVMAFETGETFSPSARNPRGSATGLIQFVESTARGLGTTTSALASMTAVQQLDFVDKYFKSYAPRIKNLGDCYMAVLWPMAIGKPDTFVMWTSTGQYQAEYNANAGLDINRDGSITRGEALSRVNRATVKGNQFIK
ncbi:MAG: hypothetical protein CTY32_08600 [Methylotenera sp.]|nr:MAG: hypothetical protein CTY32_08600 [Methylotenera sp.]